MSSLSSETKLRGSLKSLTAKNGISLSYTYWPGSLLKSETTADGTGVVFGSIAFTYDDLMRISIRTVSGVAGSEEIAYSYDAFDRPEQVGALAFSYYSTDLSSLTPQSGKLETVTLGSTTGTFTYDFFGRTDDATHTWTGGSFTSDYTYDKQNRITDIEETTPSGTVTKEYGYDGLGRLVTVHENDTLVETYTYDNNNNRLSSHAMSGDVVYNAQDQLVQYGDNHYRYDLNGNLTEKITPEGLTSYGYDELNNLVSVILPNETEISYTYDGKNRRVEKNVNGTVEYRFIYEDQLTPAAQVAADGTIIEEYVYGSSATGYGPQAGTGVNSPDYIRKDGVNYRIIKDHRGSTRFVVNSSTGEVVKTIMYDEFGTIASETGTFDILFGYAGGLRDTDTGLTHFGAREYDSVTGRWIQKDPIRFDGGLNHYVYVNGDPVNFVDVTGLAPGDVFNSVQVIWQDIEKYMILSGRNIDLYEYLVEIFLVGRDENGDPLYSYDEKYIYTDEDPTHVNLKPSWESRMTIMVWHNHIHNPRKGIYGSKKLSGLIDNEWDRNLNNDAGIAYVIRRRYNFKMGGVLMSYFDARKNKFITRDSLGSGGH